MSADVQSEESCSVFGTEYGVARTVLRNLGCKDLCRVASVCQLWNEASKNVLSHRATMHWSCEAQIEEKRPYRRVQRTFSLNDFLDEFRNSLDSLPSFCICFTTADSLHYKEESDRFGTCRHHLLDTPKSVTEHAWMELITKRLPQCPILLVKCPGIVGTDKDNQQVFEHESAVGVTILSFPKLPDFHITPFRLNKGQINRAAQGVKGKDELLALTHLPQDIQPKAVLIFTNARAYGFVGSLSEEFSSCFENEVAIGGGFIEHSVLLPLTEQYNGPDVFGLVFHGDGVQAASLVVACQDNEGVEAKIKELKECNLPEEKSVCFMFACVGRGFCLFGQEDYETKVFRKYFPKTPVFGFFGNGEIGCDYLPKPKTENRKFSFSSENNQLPKKAKLGREYTHGYTTILVLLSFNKSS